MVNQHQWAWFPSWCPLFSRVNRRGTTTLIIAVTCRRPTTVHWPTLSSCLRRPSLHKSAHQHKHTHQRHLQQSYLWLDRTTNRRRRSTRSPAQYNLFSRFRSAITADCFVQQTRHVARPERWLYALPRSQAKAVHKLRIRWPVPLYTYLVRPPTVAAEMDIRDKRRDERCVRTSRRQYSLCSYRSAL